MQTMFEQVRGNKNRSILLMFFFIVVVGLLGAFVGIIWGNTYIGLSFSVIISIIYSVLSYYSGDQLILKMTGARPVTKGEYPYLYNTIEGLALSAGVPTPKAYVIDDSALNAFATGRDPKHASITVTTGLLKVMNRQELEGVIAHEMSHVKNYDIRFMMLTTVLVGLVTLLSDFILRSMWYGRGGGRRDEGGRGGQAQILLLLVGFLFALLAPFIGQLIRLAISRQREYLADANAAVLTRYPPGLASALEKIRKDPDPLVDNANKATAHLFISTPFRDETGFVVNLFSTHPPIAERIKRLREM
jgi:heat shock protein HtpX